ncbi:MAG: DUF294 nucleotidyltransferase-like domain-containing protein [Marinobacterium sp.]|nr:DUF294 nucleotidyltransferase-like domain-containing protein [Marinobacterium sp.]
METEQLEVQSFLSRYPPFDSLPEEDLARLACAVEISYYRADSDISRFGDEAHDLGVVRSGVVEVYRRSGELHDRQGAGTIFGQMALLMDNRVRFPARAVEDTLVYFVPEYLFDEFYEQHERFADFVELEDRQRLRQTVARKERSNDQLNAPVESLISRDAVTLHRGATIQQAAVTMTEEGVSSLLIMDTVQDFEDDPQASLRQQLVGVITDRDLRTRVLATGLSLDETVDTIMSTELVTLDDGAYVFEALLAMLRYNVHHLPVLKQGLPTGVLALSDIVRYESQHSLFLVSNIFRQNSVDELAELASEVRASFVRMVNEDANSHMIGSAMAVIGRSFKQRLLELAEEQLGPPPVAYCFLALGSMARDEQLIVTDQDNALILDNYYDPERHERYFVQLAEFVCQGLDRCGYSLCTGEIMATNPQWRKTRQQWRECFSEWIEKPDPRALLNCSIFFDLDGVWGATEWADQLNRFIVRKAQHNPRFLACLARNAISRTPPLGFFQDFVMEKDGQHNNSINLKRRGTAPLADLIRVHALAVGSDTRNSFERLDDIIEANLLPSGRGPDLRDAMEFIATVRIRHQARDIEEGRDPDNNIEPEYLSDFERRNLKDAFQILSNAQKFLKFRYNASR